MLPEYLYEHLAPEDTVVFVTANSSLSDMIQADERLFAGADTPSLAIIDAAADHRFEDTYHDIDVGGVPGVADLTNSTVGITDLAADADTGDGAVHVLVPDLGPVLTYGLALVGRMLRSLADGDAVTGAVLVGFEYPSVESETVTPLHESPDTVLWADRLTDGTIRFTRDRSGATRAASRGGSGEAGRTKCERYCADTRLVRHTIDDFPSYLCAERRIQDR